VNCRPARYGTRSHFFPELTNLRIVESQIHRPGDMLKNPGRRLISLTGTAPQRICRQCQSRLQHSTPAEFPSEAENFAENTRSRPQQNEPRRSQRRPIQHPPRQPRRYIARHEQDKLPELEFMRAVRSRPQFPDRRPTSSPVDLPSKPPLLLEKDLNQVTEVS